MSTLEQRLERLERTNDRYRWIIGGLACLMLLFIGVGAAKTQDGGKLVLDELVIRDTDGRKRIWLNGSLMVLLDANEKRRISAATLPDGEVAIGHIDANEKMRINAGTMPDGTASITHYDANVKERIVAVTFPDGTASIFHRDANEKMRIAAWTLRDGTASIIHDAVSGP